MNNNNKKKGKIGKQEHYQHSSTLTQSISCQCKKENCDQHEVWVKYGL